jgi:uncharacterized HAD superfamily protein/adenine/guanine phosphoribosyltransferase-like PRPP-binding protein
MHYKSFTDLNDDIKKNIHLLQNKNFDLVVGIPRSGMIPAYKIALFLNLECTDINSFIRNEVLKKGKTRQSKNNLIYPHKAKKILLVDDSIYTGNSLKKELADIPQKLKNKITTLAIYSSKESRDDIDIFFEYVPMPRVFEWNIFHHSILSLSCVDIDGVLCLDPTNKENDDGERYKNFLVNAKPLFLPTGKIYALVTSRLEKYRKETETWLKKYNIEYEYLIMLDLPTMYERRKLGIHAKHKADYYKKSKAVLFIESNPSQSIEIRNRTSKNVYCVENNTLYKADILNIIKNNPKGISKYMPDILKRVFRK